MLTFNATQESIGKQFGAIGVTEFRQELAGANAQFAQLGMSAADAQVTISAIANDFGALQRPTFQRQISAEMKKFKAFDVADIVSEAFARRVEQQQDYNIIEADPIISHDWSTTNNLSLIHI